MSKADGNYEFGTIDSIQCERCKKVIMWTPGGLGSTSACCGIRYDAFVPEDDPTHMQVISARDRA